MTTTIDKTESVDVAVDDKTVTTLKTDTTELTTDIHVIDLEDELSEGEDNSKSDDDSEGDSSDHDYDDDEGMSL